MGRWPGFPCSLRLASVSSKHSSLTAFRDSSADSIGDAGRSRSRDPRSAVQVPCADMIAAPAAIVATYVHDGPAPCSFFRPRLEHSGLALALAHGLVPRGLHGCPSPTCENSGVMGPAAHGFSDTQGNAPVFRSAWPGTAQCEKRSPSPQCFDLESYLQLNCERGTWRCPVCK